MAVVEDVPYPAVVRNVLEAGLRGEADIVAFPHHDRSAHRQFTLYAADENTGSVFFFCVCVCVCSLVMCAKLRTLITAIPLLSLLADLPEIVTVASLTGAPSCA